MWFLTCDGDLLSGKRLWLRPGSTHLLGRTSGRSDDGERIQYIDNKSVSRKHLIIRVGSVEAGDSARLHKRSQIQVTDGSKTGTAINGDKIAQVTRVLEGKDFRIKLGSYQQEFRLRWTPVTLSFTSLGKKAKSAGDPLQTQRSKLEQADVKLISEYVTNETSHVISKKRNTPAVLQALAQARWVVTDDFVQALISAVYKLGESISSLEEDFDANWPQETKFILPSGAEPQPRSNEYLKPNPERAELFRAFTFVFLSKTQYELLLPVVAAAGGKALLWEFEEGKSRSKDLIKYVKELAGHKGSGQFRLSQIPGEGGVVVVRLNAEDNGWVNFSKAVEIELDQRSIEQNEFLDAILTLDSEVLKRQLKEAEDGVEISSSMRPLATPAVSQARQDSPPKEPVVPTAEDSSHAPPLGTATEAQEEQSQPPASSESANRLTDTDATTAAAKRRARRLVTNSRFKGFDDFDPSQASRRASNSPEPSVDPREPSQGPSVQTMDIDEPADIAGSTQRPLKRPAPTPDDNEEDMYESMLTGVAAMKRRKLEAARNGEKNAFAERSVDSNSVEASTTTKVKKKPKDMDVMAEVQKRREAEEEQRRKDEETLREGLNGIDISELKNLAKVEEMDVPVRARPQRQTHADGHSDRWDPAWNGRRNFKKFRPQGSDRDPLRLRPVIVTLVEAPRRGRGVGDDYWLEPSSTRSKSKSQSQSESAQHSGARSQLSEETAADTQRFRRRLQSSREQDADHAVAEDILPEEVAGTAQSEDISQTLGTGSQRKAAGKRPATQSSIAPPAKKAKTSGLPPPARPSTAVNNNGGDDLKFRRRQR